MKSTLARLFALLVLPLVLLLSGCASTYVLDNTVQSFSQLQGLPSPATYRFERLPSQQGMAQLQLEAIADPALFAAGLKRDDADPRYSVQVGATVQRVLSPWADLDYGWGWGWGHPWRHHGWSSFGMWSHIESPWYHREVSVILRDLKNNRVVYETHAANDGPWRDNVRILPAMFQAAMQGFPTPPPGPRRVDIQMPR